MQTGSYPETGFAEVTPALSLSELASQLECPLEIIQRHIKIMHGHLDVAPAPAREEEKRQRPHDQDMKLPRRSILRNW